MYQLEKNHYGIHLKFEGFIQADEVARWFDEVKALLESQPIGFGVFADMRAAKPFPPQSRVLMQNAQKYCKEKGMGRSVVIIQDYITSMQFEEIAKDSGIDQWERYIDASQTPDFEDRAIAWLVSGIEPNEAVSGAARPFARPPVAQTNGTTRPP